MRTLFLASLVCLLPFSVEAQDTEIFACMNRSGKLTIIGDPDSKREECRRRENLRSWNIQGPEGPQGPDGQQGEQGEAGEPAQQGAGNIAFFHVIGENSYFLKIDGTGWTASNGSGWTPGTPGPYSRAEGLDSPIPVEDIVNWKRLGLVDKYGNYWFKTQQMGWQSFGPLP